MSKSGLNTKKYVNLIFLGAGGLLWFVARHYTEKALGYFQAVRIWGPSFNDVFHHVFPALLGIGCFVLLRRSQSSSKFVQEAVAELSKVTWPNQSLVRRGTIGVIFAVTFSGLVLGLLDLGVIKLVTLFLRNE